MSDVQEQPAAPAAEGEAAPDFVGPVNEGAVDQVDSTYAPSVGGTETTSLKSAITKYREENGRTYHSYGSTEHWGPNDEKAQDQQDLSHHLWTLSLKGDFFLSPVKDPVKILDVGTGTGIWVIEVAEQFPQAEVTGTDVSPIQPGWVPPNAFFEIDDFNVEWLDENKFDLVHARELLGTCPDWPALYRRAFRAIKPGGWFEQHEPGLFFLSDHVEFGEDSPYVQWNTTMYDAGIKSGMRFDIGDKIKGRMEEAGFINVTEYRIPWLVGGWSKDEHQRKIGQWNQLRLDIGIADFCSRRFTNHLGFTPEQVEVFCAGMRNSFRDKKLYSYIWAYFVYGQKPEE
ncbi:uncharacterized protein LTR77_004715 [Saxophila tyrrhenica]|uniref:S-adenosyl-L-methionine-dependent methyltransferase n=1 Tax=Saxophila tyrrhenica TaxID=1690608 RepID=A0AAV9PAS5_9PEZI|nr:hypothetical protein LTR77_004715 [Saxophila tyrrhenica]